MAKKPERVPSLRRRLLTRLLVPLGALAVGLGVGGSALIHGFVQSTHDRLLAGSTLAIAERLAVDDDNGEVTVDLPAVAFGMLESQARDSIYYNVAHEGGVITGYLDLPLPDISKMPTNVTVFREDRLLPFPLADGLTVWGAAHLEPAGTRSFLDGFAVDRGGVHIGLFHGSERSAMSAEDASKVPHAPFTAAQVPAAGLHFALVGHLHTPSDGSFHAYPGNPEPLSFGETGQRGALVVDVDAAGGVRTTRHVIARTDVVDVDLDVTGLGHSGAIRAAVVELLGGCRGVARLRVRGDLDPGIDLDPGSWRSMLPGLDGLVVRTDGVHEAYDVDALAGEQTVRGEFVCDVVAAVADPVLRRRILTTGLRALDGRDDLAVL